MLFRSVSISGNILPDGEKQNRSYFGNTARISNGADIEAFDRGVEAADDLGVPVVTILKARNPIIPSEFEEKSDGIVAGFDISEEASIEVALGLRDSTGRLPVTFPANMETVEASFEDVAADFDPYEDSVGNTWSFGFGLSCEGPLD